MSHTSIVFETGVPGLSHYEVFDVSEILAQVRAPTMALKSQYSLDTDITQTRRRDNTSTQNPSRAALRRAPINRR